MPARSGHVRVCCGRGGHFSFVGPPNYAACLRRLPSPNIYTQDARVLHPHRDMTVFTNSIFFFFLQVVGRLSPLFIIMGSPHGTLDLR